MLEYPSHQEWASQSPNWCSSALQAWTQPSFFAIAKLIPTISPTADLLANPCPKPAQGYDNFSQPTDRACEKPAAGSIYRPVLYYTSRPILPRSGA